MQEVNLKKLQGIDIKLLLNLDISYLGLGKKKPRLHLMLPENDGLLAKTKLHWTLKLAVHCGLFKGS